jgi:hypothetical protein
MMNSREVEDLLSNVRMFVGVYSRDTMPNTNHRPIAFVVNTDSKTEPGEHWNAVVLLPGGFAEFFNSFGFPPLHPCEQSYIDKHAWNGMKYNMRTLQHHESKVCGLYCVDFIRSRANGSSLRQYISNFSGNLKLNDDRVFERVTSNHDREYNGHRKI